MLILNQPYLEDLILNPQDRTSVHILADILDDQNVLHPWRQETQQSLTELSPYQESLLDFWSQYWIQVGLKTGPTDHNLAQQTITKAYEIANLEPPKNWVWAQSPLEAIQLAAKIQEPKVQTKVRYKVLYKVYNKVCDKVRDKVRTKVHNKVQTKVHNNVCNKVWYKVRDKGSDKVRDKVRTKVWYKVQNRVHNNVWNKVWYNICYGQHDAHWISFYSYFACVTYLECTLDLVPLIQAAHYINWWLPYETTCILTELPVRMDQGSLYWNDGFTVKIEE